MQAHANDLRSEVENDWGTLVDPDSEPAGESAYDRLVHQVVDRWRDAALTPALLELLEFTERVTLSSAARTEADIARLRKFGWSDRAIHDAVQVISYFNYINRVAEALGVEDEEGLPHWGSRGRA